jgi:hypothetical protein
MLLSIGNAAKQFELKGNSSIKIKTNFIGRFLEVFNLTDI